MASNLSKEEIARLISTCNNYSAFFVLVGIVSGVLVAWAAIYTDMKRNRILYSDFWIAFFLACIYSSCIIGLLIIYFGIPKSLTFGQPIGKIIPSTCGEDSIAIEGQNGLPCSLKRFSEWTTRCVSNDGSCNLDEFERIWLKTGILILVLIALPIGGSFAFRKARLSDMAEESAKQAMV